LLDVEKWGTTAWTSMANAFFGCSNLNITATDIPNLSSVNSMDQMFQGCSNLSTVPNINSWITSNVEWMSSVFNNCKNFNQNIGNWNTSKVRNMRRMFMSSSFNQNIGGWNTANVYSMLSMFENSSFNQNIGGWNTAGVEDMTKMFNNATSFNQNLGNWSLKANVNLSNMLDNSGLDCSNYAATLTGWNATGPNNRTLGAGGRTYPNSSARTNLVGAKGWIITGDAVSSNSCGAFITRWNLASPNTTTLSFGTATSGTVAYNWESIPSGFSGSGTFTGNTLNITGLPSGATIRLEINPTNFQRINIGNQPVGSRLLDVEKWGTTVWTSMQSAFFGCNKLNITATDIPNLSSCTNMNDMFQGCSSLTGPANINSWNTATVTGMVSMFFNASKFNQNIGNWTLNANVNMTNMLSNSGMDCSNYSATLIGWSANPLTPNGRTLGATGRTYGAYAAAARTNLDVAKNWTINSDALGSCVAPPAAGIDFTSQPAMNKVIAEPSIWPNPVKNMLNIGINERYRNEKLYLTVTDMKGTVLVSRTVTNGNSAISTAAWSKALYVVTLRSGRDIIMTKKIIKQ
jgi:trimeric autotransporter adhesin